MTARPELSRQRSADPAAGSPLAAAPLVLKLGGRALETPGALGELAAALARRARPTVLVHGGGRDVTDWCSRLGIESAFVDGLRVTRGETLDVAVAVLAGLANKRLVAALRAAGLDAVGLSLCDGGTLEVRPHVRAAQLGAVGEPAAADVSLLGTLLAQGRTPVLASIGAHAGALLNVNADDAAAALAVALRAEALVLLSDTPGLTLERSLVASLSRDALRDALAHPDVRGGMAPKLAAAAAALDAGVSRIHVGAWSGPDSLAALLAQRQGTTFHALTEDAHA